MHNDDYETCEKTYASLCIYPGDMDPKVVTKRLGIEPTSFHRSGEPLPCSKNNLLAKINGWFLCSENIIESKDSQRHVDWILDQLYAQRDAVLELQKAGCKMDVACFWASKHGHGGPTISPEQMRRLADLNLDLWFDFYNNTCNE
jgi:hypothetical protein